MSRKQVIYRSKSETAICAIQEWRRWVVVARKQHCSFHETSCCFFSQRRTSSAVTVSQRCAARNFPNPRIGLELFSTNASTASWEMDTGTSRAACHPPLSSKSGYTSAATVHVDVRTWEREVGEIMSNDGGNLQTWSSVASHWKMEHCQQWCPEFLFLHLAKNVWYRTEPHNFRELV